MLIGIDMLAVQSPGSGARESGILGRGLVSALLAKHSDHRFVLYTHEGLPTDLVPSSRNALRVSLPGAADGPAERRSTIRRVLEQNPDGLGWLVLLDPFEEGYGGIPPETPCDGVKVASLITDLAPGRVDDRRLAPLRRHDAILADSESTADECRRRLPMASHLVSRLGLALDESWTGLGAIEPFGVATGAELGRLGVGGPFLFANMASGAGRSNLAGVLQAYQRLRLDYHQNYQLVIAGELDDPWAAIAFLHDRGCADGLVLVGPADESTRRILYSRCSAFLSPSFREASELSLIEAMSCSAPVVAGRAGSQPEILAGAGLLAEPTDASEIAGQVALVLSDIDLQLDLRGRSRLRSEDFSWEPVVERFFAVLEGAESSVPEIRYRFEPAHIPRPRVAIFACGSDRPSSLRDFVGPIASASRSTRDVDVYLDPSDTGLGGGLAVEFGGFDARQFAGNDDRLGYETVFYLFPDIFSVNAKLGQLEDRPGVVFLRDGTSLDRIEIEQCGAVPLGIDVEAEVACQRLHELFLTSSLLVVQSTRNLAAIRSRFPEFADRIIQTSSSGRDDLLASVWAKIHGAGSVEPSTTPSLLATLH